MQLKHTLKFAMAAIIGMTTLSSCEKDDNWNDDLEKTGYIAVGTVKKTDGKFYVEEDDLNTIMTRNYQCWNDTMIGKRVWIKFYNYKKNYQESGFGQTAYLFDLGRKLLTKPVFKIETKTQDDSLGNDGISIRAAWITGKYVNVEFVYAGSRDKIHFINLAQNLYQNAAASQDTIRLEFRHNANNDTPYTYYQGVASFDITDIYPAKGGKLAISYKPYNYSSKQTFYINVPNSLYTFSSK